MGKMKDSTIPDYDQHSHEPIAGQSSDDDAMTVQKSQFQTIKSYSHDPLCPNRNYEEWQPCVPCDLIASVREDERLQILAGAGLTLDEAIQVLGLKQ